MTRLEATKVLQKIFREVFEDSTILISDQTNSSEIEKWDSLHHVTLIYFIEKQYNIQFSLGEIANLQQVGQLVDLIVSKLAANAI